MNSFFHRVKSQTATRFWINNVTKKEAQMAIDYGADGCTQNPSYTHKILTHRDEDAKNHALVLLKKHLATCKNDNDVQIALQKDLVNDIAGIFLPLYQDSFGKEGFVSIQGDPMHEDSNTITELALYHRENTHPNIMAKIPGTEEGLKSIEKLMREGVPLNITEVFALSQVREVCNIYNHVKAEVSQMPAVYISHITGIYDEYMQNWVEKNDIKISSDILYQSGMIIAKKAYEYMQHHAPEIGFIGGGARGLQHFIEMIGAKASITINWIGTADKLIEQNHPVIEHFCRPVNNIIVDELLSKVPVFKEGYLLDGLSVERFEEFGPVDLFRSSFLKSWDEVLNIISKER